MHASPRLLFTLLTASAFAALAAAPSGCWAQYEDHCGPFCDAADFTDFQFFEPVDLDLNCEPVRADCGFFFTYGKNYWAMTGERTAIGDQNAVVVSEIIFPENNDLAEQIVGGFPAFLDENNQIPTAVPGYLVQNDLQDVPPDAEFGWGDRYEMGYVDQQGRGFSIGIIDGNRIESEQIYGFGDVGTGFGSVHVNFATPEGYLEGWRDYGFEALELDVAVNVGVDDDDSVLGVGPTVSGPGGDGADGEIDDILINGVTFFVVDVNMDGVIDLSVDLFYIDYGDLHEFNIRFENIGVRNVSKIDGIELMRTIQLDNRHWMRKHQHQRLEIGYGARLFRLEDRFLWDGETDIAGRWFADTEVENQIVGPQFRVKWSNQQAKWNFSVMGSCLLGYNVGDLNQDYGIGETFTPGALNNPIIAQPTYGANGRQEITFSPVAELRADLKYQVTRSIALNVGYNAMFIDNITRASQVVEYTLPNIGLSEGGDQNIFINGVNFGVEIWH